MAKRFSKKSIQPRGFDIVFSISRQETSFVTRFGKIRINAATNYFCFFLLTGYTGPEDLDFQV